MKSLLVVMMTFVESRGNNNKQLNKVEFEDLFSILRIGEDVVNKIPNKLRNYIEPHNLLKKLLYDTQTPTAMFQKVIQLKQGDAEDTKSTLYTVKRRNANDKIQHVMEKTNDTYSLMEEELIQATRERTLVRNNLAHVIYGVQVGEPQKEEDISSLMQNMSWSSISNKMADERK
ncbi:unnamed protein product [Trypanosoma congolense IL3000]|uniref:WGS project CAEQ00000000 data, annotated contig 1371 n=1 Tax=Trypanosoma congolense (strain IL3000) TaxID=1068625 RepID=F9W5T1_TRYCI|nr:unnamed protein product [Trypanosoma congolense IL3000]